MLLKGSICPRIAAGASRILPPGPLTVPEAKSRGNSVVAYGGILYSYTPDNMVPPNSSIAPRKTGASTSDGTGASTSGRAASAAEAVSSLPVTTPLPLCSAKEVQRLLTAVETPDYVLRAFRENCITGQDLMGLTAEDMLDQRFKLPHVIIRKVLRIPASWQLMCAITGSDTCISINHEEFVTFLEACGLCATGTERLLQVFRRCSTKQEDQLSLEEFVFSSGFLIGVLHNELEVRGNGSSDLPGGLCMTAHTGDNMKIAAAKHRLIQATDAFKQQLFHEGSGKA